MSEAVRPELSVALVGICSPEHVDRALHALSAQEGVPPLEIVVAADPRIGNLSGVAARHPEVRFLAAEAVQSPLQLVGRAIDATRGHHVLLTEDHCVPPNGWAQAMWRGLQADCGAVGGPIEISDEATATDFAFYFVDFYRYARPIRAATAAPSLSVCNVGYRREDLEGLSFDWQSLFVDALVHDALAAERGPLQIVDEAGVRMRRHVRLRDAVRERYVFGRVFGSQRLSSMSFKDKWTFRLAAGLLPAMILKRMGTKALESPELTRRFVRALGPLWLLTVAWSTGEVLGYWTGSHPEDLSVAPEIPA